MALAPTQAEEEVMMPWQDDLEDEATREAAAETAPARVIADIFIQLRSKLGLTQHALASAAGIPQPAIARIESGTSSPTWATLFKILSSVGADLELKLPPQGRQRSLEVASSGFVFRAVPDRPGMLDVAEAETGKRDGLAVVFAGTPIRSLAPTKNGVLVRTGGHEARVVKNLKGYWTVSDVRLLEADER